jgi:hypothetical protein
MKLSATVKEPSPMPKSKSRKKKPQQGGVCLGRRHVAQGALGCCPSCSTDQIQFLLDHVSIQTTEHYLGCKQRLRSAVNDRMRIEPDAA